MDKSILKKIRDNMPEFLKYASAGFIRNKLLTNKVFQETYKLLEEREKYSENFIHEYQFAQLKKTLVHAGESVPYYSELFKKIGFDPKKMNDPEEIKEIPVLTRKLVNENFNQLIATKNTDGGYYQATSGGTTGMPIKVLHDYNTIFAENAFIYFFRKKLGYQFKHRLATFREVGVFGKPWRINPMYNELIFSPVQLSLVTYKKYLAKINAYQPDYLHGYLSAIYYFAKLLSQKRLNLKTRLKGIFLISETENRVEREFVENYFNTRALTFYGLTERCAIAPEISSYRYQFDPFYSYTEFRDNADRTKTIIGTGFLNNTMPLIRYETDDSCTPAGNGYKISGKWKSNKGLFGKNMEFLTHAAFSFHHNIFKNVIRAQYVQSEIGKAKLLLIPGKDFNGQDLSLIKKELAKKTNGFIDFELEVTNKLVLSGRGKFNEFNNTIKSDVLVP